MTKFIQLHLLTTYPPSNLNRDDLGSPKSAVFGGQPRLRISSQCLKRSWRVSDVFREQSGGGTGERTRRRGRRVHDALIAKGVGEGDARKWARDIAVCFGALSVKKDSTTTALDDALSIEQICHFGPDELEEIDALIMLIAERNSAPTEDELEALHRKTTAVDTAMFGRMLAAKPKYNIEAAVQVAHAITINRVAIETDFFTAVDDLNDGSEDMGSGFMGEFEYGAGTYYLYACIDKDLLVSNVGGSSAAADAAIEALIEAMATVAPSGKQASFASRARASYIMVEGGAQQPRTLIEAFLTPTDSPAAAIEKLKEKVAAFDNAYGACADHRETLDVVNGSGTLDDVKRAATS